MVLCPTVLGLGLAVCGGAWAQSTGVESLPELQAEVERLRSELAALRAEYEARVAALEARLAAATPAPAPQPSPPAEVTVPAGAAGAGGPSGSLPVYGSPSLASKIFNPDVAVIGDFGGAAGRNDVEPETPLEMRETEVAFQAVVDPYARADFFVAFAPDEVELEEGFLTFPALPGGFLMKVGKLKNAFGVVNTLHNHLQPWVDRPLILDRLLGGEEGIADAGVSVSRLVPNPWIFLEATGEVYRGESSVFSRQRRRDVAFVGRLRGYGDLSESTNLDLGASFATGTNDAGPGSRTRLLGVDATFRYRPLRRAIYRRLLSRTEVVWRRTDLEDGARADAVGGYFATDYPLARRWFAGLRLDYAERAADPSLAEKGVSALLTFWPSEFSQVRAQFRRIRYAEGRDANEVLFQFLFSIGAHGAHAF
jgi:hypothetical protein